MLGVDLRWASKFEALPKFMLSVSMGTISLHLTNFKTKVTFRLVTVHLEKNDYGLNQTSR